MKLPKSIPMWLAAVLLAAALLLGMTFIPRLQQISEPGRTVELQSPPFVNVIHAQGDDSSIENPSNTTANAPAVPTDLTSEAGISAWYEATTSIDLDLARNAFRTIESETSEYIIGSIDIPVMPEHFDVHGYVHKDGWLMTYYLQDEPVSKIVDTATKTIDSTLLDNGLSILAGSAGVGLGESSYYDFRYPNATHILFVAEDDVDGRDFSITLPSDYGYFERGWALRGNWYSDSWRLDGVIQTGTYWDNTYGYGSLSASQMATNIEHFIEVYDWGVLVIVYRVP